MKKTTVYLPDELKRSLEQMARDDGRSEAELIRSAIQTAVEERKRPRPRIPLAAQPLGDPTVAERVDELLDGFGGS